MTATMPRRLRDLPPEDGIALVCVPHAGAGASSFARWPRLFAAPIGLVRAQLPGREDCATEQPLQRVADAVALLLPEIAALPRVALYGHSMGAVIAFELARALSADGQPPAHLFVSGRRAPQCPARHGGVHRLPDSEFAEALGGAIIGPPRFLRYALGLTRADLTLSEEYTGTPEPRLACPITAFHGRDDPIVALDEVQAWAEVTTRAFALHLFEGEHLFHQPRRAELAALMTGALG
ncbi:alpha/beta fold hydrolase [Pseudonocardia kujensis]|uniref:thioesterase II family protein n=1 Tax=Pseudonocardia kujensis TaxID=1128675 RepID=UPI001E5A9B28|nr:alpha/beta fold hydrolase [Pseudonocardia kujensis]MCE0764881.1 alpha/beta fold hydrolase [Pseudonocardia kujensis]